MAREHFCSYEVSKLLKDNGFNDTCRAFWLVRTSDHTLYECSRDHAFDFCTNESLSIDHDEAIAAPSVQMAKEWIMEKYDTYCLVEVASDGKYFPIIKDCVDGCWIFDFGFENRGISFDTEYEALGTMFMYVLQNKERKR